MTKELKERWIVRYRRYHSDPVSERVFASRAEAHEFAHDYLYDSGSDATARVVKLVEVGDD